MQAAAHGAKEQCVHSDMVYSANALVHSQTFLLLYTFFIPLQDTTADMDSTTVANNTSKQVWPAGYSTLANM
eukprot:14033797-Ditylum_brightwellii.AAC.1